MDSTLTLCIKVSDTRICPHCQCKSLIKNGFTKNKKQQFFCKQCLKRCISFYSNKAYEKSINNNLIQLIKEGVGIRSIARLLGISANTVLRRIHKIAKKVELPTLAIGKIYEVDEIYAKVFGQLNKVWIVYALERSSKKIVSFSVGSRSIYTLRKAIERLMVSVPKRIYTDRLNLYPLIIPAEIHGVDLYGTNCIERKNLTMRIHLKRLQRRSICYTRSIAILTSILKIYFYT